MSEDTAPERVAVMWATEARVDLRAIDREAAMQILYCVDRYLTGRTGDVKKLKPPRTGFRSAAAITASFSIRKTRTRSRSLASATEETPTAEQWLNHDFITRQRREPERPVTASTVVERVRHEKGRAHLAGR